MKRKDVDLSVLDNDGNTAFSSEILSNSNAFDHITMCRKFFHLEKVIDLLKKSNIDFSIGNSNFRTVSTALLNNMHLYRQNIPTYMVVRNKILHPIVDLLRNNENKITIKIVENLLENTNFLKCLEDLQHIPKPQLVDLINSQDCEGNTLLHLAAEYGMFKEVRFLLEKGAKTDILNVDGYTALHLAAFNGELDQYRNLIPLDDDSPNPFLKKSNFNETPEDIQKNTLENSERQTIRTYEKMDQRTTKVLMRLCNKHLKKNREELKEKKDSDLIDRSKQRKTSAPEPKSPKWRKSYFAKYIMSIKTKFLKLSADLKNLLPAPRTTSIFNVTDSKSSKKLPEITTILNIVDSKGNTILHGLLKENEDFIRGLHKNIADPIERKAQIKRKHAELAIIIQEFVQFGFDATKKNSDGDTALHLAARTGDTSLFAAFALVKEKNDVSQPNKGLGKESAPGVTLNGEIFLIPNEAGKTPLDIISSASADELEERINQYNDDIKVREAGLGHTKTPSILQINGDLKSKKDNDLTI